MAEFHAISTQEIINELTYEKQDHPKEVSTASLPLQLKLAEFCSLAKVITSKGYLSLMQRLNHDELNLFIDLLVKTNFGSIPQLDQGQIHCLFSLEALRLISINSDQTVSLNLSAISDLFAIHDEEQVVAPLLLVK